MPSGVWIVIPNWDHFQHYSDRNPAWIKTYTALLHNPGYLKLTGHQRAILHGLWLAYASSHCQLTADTSSLTRQLGLRVSSQQLVALNHAGFLDFSASKPLARRYQNASQKEEVLRTSSKTRRRSPQARSGGDAPKKKKTALAEAEQLASEWNGHDSDTFAEALDEIARRHHTRLNETERSRLWTIAFE